MATPDPHESDLDHNTAPESISTQDAAIEPAERERQGIEANALRASLKT